MRAYQIQNQMQALKNLGFDEKLVLKLISDPKKLRSSLDVLTKVRSILDAGLEIAGIA